MKLETNCERIKPILPEFLFEEIALETRRDVEAHLQSCTSCSRELGELKQTVSLLVRGEASEEIPRNIRLVAEPPRRWAAFWRNSARLGFASAALFCVAIGLLALFRTTLSYHNGTFQIAFGAPVVSSGAPLASMAATAQPPDRAQIQAMISESTRAMQAEQARQSGALAQDVAARMQERWQQDLREMSESLRYFQAAQTMMWKEQVQNQQLVSALVQRSELPATRQP